MKKTIVMVFAFLVVFGFTITGAMAQTWTWEYAPVKSPPAISKLTVNPATNDLYGLSGDAVALVELDSTGGLTEQFETPAESGFNEIAFGYQGTVYAITNNSVASCLPSDSCSLIPQQPNLPSTTGTFSDIAAGKNGKLFVLYNDNESQYILTGNPPITEGLGVKLNPQSLNLGSKGKWVTCQVQLPEGKNIADLDTSSIKITNFKVGEDGYEVSIPVDNNAPVGTSEYKRIIKFIRYDKADPANPASMVGALSDIFAEQSKGKIDVTATVQASLFNGETFSGEATFKVIVPKAKKQK